MDIDALDILKRLLLRPPLSPEETERKMRERANYEAALKLSNAENLAASEKFGAVSPCPIIALNFSHHYFCYIIRARMACASSLHAVYQCQDKASKNMTTFCSDEADAFFRCFREHRGFIRARILGIDVDLSPAINKERRQADQ